MFYCCLHKNLFCQTTQNKHLQNKKIRHTDVEFWYQYLTSTEKFNTGDDIAGTIAAVGSNVVEFKEGDRVVSLQYDGFFLPVHHLLGMKRS